MNKPFRIIPVCAVIAEMHVYERGGHGFGLGKQHSAESSWSVRCEDWMRGQGLLDNSNRQFRNTESKPP